MPLADENTGMVHGLGQAQLEDQGLKAALQEVLGRHGQHVIQFALRLIQQPILVHAPQQGLALKEPLRFLVVQRQQGPGSLRIQWRTLSTSAGDQQPSTCRASVKLQTGQQ